MLFDFIKYVMPTWYFNLPFQGSQVYFPDFDKICDLDMDLLDLDWGYSSPDGVKLDAAYQCWHKGVMVFDNSSSLPAIVRRPSLSDNYRFIRRFFHPLWSWFVLIIRLFSFKNPFAECYAFYSQRKVRRVDVYERVYNHEVAYSVFKSILLVQSPKVSIIIPTLNRYTWLKDALQDLEKQDYKNFEVIVVDQSYPFQPEFYDQFALDLKLIRQEENALWLARNTAIRASVGDFILLYDDDSRTNSDWISEYIKAMDYFQADIVSGVSLSVVGAKTPDNYRFFRWGDQLDTGNAMVRRTVFRKLGLFDRQFEGQRMGDGEFGLRAYIAGFINVSHPYAKRVHLKIGQGGLRQMGSWDAFRPKSLLSPRPVPSVLYLYRRYFGEKNAILSLLQNIPISILPYKYKGQKTMTAFSFIVIVPLLPFILIQVFKSWTHSSKQISEGPKIESLAA